MPDGRRRARRAVVTGASRGIGAAIALRAATAGYAVVVNYSTDGDGARSVVAEIQAKGGTACSVQAHVSNPLQVAALFDAAAAVGTIGAVVNNACIAGYLIGNLTDVPSETIRRVVDVNVNGLIFVCQEAVQGLSTENGGRGGSIVNVSSTATKAGSRGTWAHYAASKGAVDVLAVGLASEVAKQGIKVNCMGGGAEPDEVAAAVVWLMSNDGGYMTGAVLPVSGGR